MSSSPLMEETLSGGAIATVSALMGHCCIPHIHPGLPEPGPGAHQDRAFQQNKKNKTVLPNTAGKTSPKNNISICD